MDGKSKEVRAFLRDLTRLTNKYGIKIWGCNCCGSPALMETKGNAEYQVSDRGDDLRYGNED